jgi:hypothetical protein
VPNGREDGFSSQGTFTTESWTCRVAQVCVLTGEPIGRGGGPVEGRGRRPVVCGGLVGEGVVGCDERPGQQDG